MPIPGRVGALGIRSPGEDVLDADDDQLAIAYLFKRLREFLDLEGGEPR